MANAPQAAPPPHLCPTDRGKDCWRRRENGGRTPSATRARPWGEQPDRPWWHGLKTGKGGRPKWGDWECLNADRCQGFLNFAKRVDCHVCKTPKEQCRKRVVPDYEGVGQRKDKGKGYQGKGKNGLQYTVPGSARALSAC